MSFSSPFNLASSGFLTASVLISNSLNLPFELREGRGGWSIAYKKMGDKKIGLHTQEPHRAPLGFTVSPFAWQSNKAILFYFTQNSVSEILQLRLGRKLIFKLIGHTGSQDSMKLKFLMVSLQKEFSERQSDR